MNILYRLLRFKNELILASAVVLFVGAFLFDQSSRYSFDKASTQTKSASAQITQIASMKRFWQDRSLKKKLKALKASIPASSIKQFDLLRSKLQIELKGLSGKDMNRIANKLASLPLKISSMQIISDAGGKTYQMECRCGW